MTMPTGCISFTRQRTLTHAIAWSYSLLDANAQTIFHQLGIFVDGFNADAAEAICSADQTTLVHLTDHSLLARTPERWQMLAMIRLCKRWPQQKSCWR